MATVTCGLETVLADEIEELRIEIRKLILERGKVLFEVYGEVDRLLKLRCADYEIVMKRIQSHCKERGNGRMSKDRLFSPLIDLDNTPLIPIQ